MFDKCGFTIALFVLLNLKYKISVYKYIIKIEKYDTLIYMKLKICTLIIKIYIFKCNNLSITFKKMINL